MAVQYTKLYIAPLVYTSGTSAADTQDRGQQGMRYRADITAGALKVPESGIIADFVLRHLDEAGWKDALYDQNVLQARRPKTAARLTLLLRGRLTLMQPEFWTLV